MEPQSRLRGEIREEQPATELRLRLSRIRLAGHHGVHPEERERGNRFEIDIDIESSVLDGIETDELADTIDYRVIADLIREINDRQTFNLIESFAGAIASELLASFETISAVMVRVAKLTPPGLGDIDRTIAEVRRRRR